MELLGRDVAGDGEARERGQRVWLNDRDPATLRTKAHVPRGFFRMRGSAGE